MAGKPQPWLAEDDAIAFRAAFRSAVSEHHLKREDVVFARGVEHERSLSWYKEALQDGKRLAKHTAVELAGRLETLHVRLPRAIEELLESANEPIYVVPPGHSQLMANQAVKKLGRIVAPRDRARALRLLGALYAEYEKFSEEPAGRRLVERFAEILRPHRWPFLSISEAPSEPFGPDAQRVFARLRRGQVGSGEALAAGELLSPGTRIYRGPSGFETLTPVSPLEVAAEQFPPLKTPNRAEKRATKARKPKAKK